MSGAEETIDEFLKYLNLRGFDVTSINCNEKYLMYNDMYDEVLEEKTFNIYDQFNKIFFSCYDNFFLKANKIIEEFKPDMILCQLNGLAELVSISKKYKIPIIYFMHSYFTRDSDISSNYDIDLLYNDVDRIICLSNFIKDSLPNCLKEKAEVVYPYIKPEKFKCNERNPKNILFFNPIDIKGVEIIIELAKTFPAETFEVYETWRKTTKKYKRQLEMLPNVNIKRNSAEPKSLYSNAKIFLMPSQCKEGFGRGVVEANINGIPTICSNVGGIKEAAGESQVLINEYDNINHWIKALKKLLEDKNFYDNLVLNSRRNGERFNKCEIEKIILKYFHRELGIEEFVLSELEKNILNDKDVSVLVEKIN